MPDGAAVHVRSARVRLLGAGRAAALVVLAAGINGTAASFAPRYDGTYLSVGAVAVIACLEGAPIGILAALAAMVIDRILGGPGFTISTIAAYAAANIIALAGRFLLRHPTTRTPPMAEGEAALHIERLQAEVARVRKEADSHRDAAAEMRRAVAGQIEEKQKSWREERQLIERSRGEALTAVDQLRTELQKAQRDSERVRTAAKQREQELTASIAADREQLQLALESEKRARASDAQSAGEALEATGKQVEELEQRLANTEAELATRRDQHGAITSDLDLVRTQLALKVSEHEELRSTHAAMERRAAALAVQSSERVAELKEQLKGHAAVVADLDALRAQMGFKVSELEELRSAHAATEQRAAALAAQSSERIAELEEQLAGYAAIAADFEVVRAQLALRLSESEELRLANAAAEERIAALAGQSSQRIAELEEQLAQVGPELERTRAAASELMRQRGADAQRARDREERLLQQYEEENATLQADVDAAAEALRNAIRERDEVRATLAASRTEAEELASRENESLRRMATERSADAARNADLRREAEERLVSSQRDVRALHDRVEELQRRFEAEMRRAAEATAAVVTRESDVRRDLESRLHAAENRASEFPRRIEEMQSDLNAERIRSVEEKNALEAEWSKKLQSIVNNLTSDHESDLGEAVTSREAARAELRHVTGRLQEAHRLAEQNIAMRTALERDVAALRAALDEERNRGAVERAELEEKLETIGKPAGDHESDVGEMMEQREIARAERRSLEAHLHETQRAFDDATRTVAAMNHELRAARAALEEEKAARERLEVEWSGKLQQIVTHLASDHEADIGQATVEKEAAKAEARSLNLRLNAVQQTIESERVAFRSAQQKWTSIRDSLLDKMQKTEDRYRQLIEKQRQEHQTEREAIEAELRVLKTSERPFTPEEIAAIRSEALGPTEPFVPVEQIEPIAPIAPIERVESVNATEPMPAFVEERKPLILVVHHNPTLRSMTKEALHEDGYEVLTAADGAEGLRMAMSHKPAIVIADVSMPKMDGRELCQAIKGNTATASTKVVLMSGMYTNEIPNGATSADIPPDDILRKPVKLEALKASVSLLLGKSVVAG